MCGIAGLVDDMGRASDPTRTLASLAHRGPDGAGQVSLAIGKSTVWLGHTRLAIQDLTESGAQPMASADGRWLITFNGEIYNHLDLRLELSRTWRGHSDTETLVEAISAWGVEGTVPRLNGIFAFAALDRVHGRLFLVRDPFGVKPLYFTEGNGTFGFSSEIRTLSLMTARRYAIDRESLSTFLSLRFVPSPNTLLAGIMRLPPGHMLSRSILDGSQEVVCYVKPTAEQFSGSLDEATNQYQHKVAMAVRRQLLSDVPVGVLLSGGIDSAVVAAMAVEAGVRTPCFTVGYRDQTSACEIDDAAHTAKVLGLPHHVVRVDHEQLWQAFAFAVGATEEPLVTTSVLPMWYLCQRAHQDVKVVLTGQGSDELLGGYRRYQGELYRRLPLFRHLMHAARPVLDRWPRVPDAIERGAQSAWIEDECARFESEYCVFPASWRNSLVGDSGSGRALSSIRHWLDWASTGRHLSSVEKMMSVDMRLGLADDLLLYGDKVSMAHSLEARVPLLDTELVTFVESLPENYKLALRRSKIVHKQMADRYLPSAIVNRPKRGFQVPFGDMIRAAWRDRCESTLFSGHALADLGINASAVRRVWDEHQRSFRDRSRQLYALLGLIEWMNGLHHVIE
ncbi:MAG: asparagine synthase (glutamine-hydrolyzing) [Burkholderiaceae bacterium]